MCFVFVNISWCVSILCVTCYLLQTITHWQFLVLLGCVLLVCCHSYARSSVHTFIWSLPIFFLLISSNAPFLGVLRPLLFLVTVFSKFHMDVIMQNDMSGIAIIYSLRYIQSFLKVDTFSSNNFWVGHIILVSSQLNINQFIRTSGANLKTSDRRVTRSASVMTISFILWNPEAPLLTYNFLAIRFVPISSKYTNVNWGGPNPKS